MQQTNLDQLRLTVLTNGSVTPKDAFEEAAAILVNQYTALAGSTTVEAAAALGHVQEEESNQLNTSIEELNLTARTANALVNNEIRTVHDLVTLTEQDLRELKGFGSKALDEVKDKLAELEIQSMHRHGYKGRKFGRERDQRRALLKGLATNLVEYEAIETTLPKAKELVRYIEKLITKAKQGDLAGRRAVIAKLNTLDAANKLVDVIAPQLTGRTSGHVRVKRTRVRVGDAAQLAEISFVDELKPVEKAVKGAK